MGVKKIIAVSDYVDFAIAWFHMFVMNITHHDVCIDSCLCDNRISENGIVGSNMVFHFIYIYIHLFIHIHPTFMWKAYTVLLISQYIIELFVLSGFIMSHCLNDIKDVTPRTVLNLPIR